MTYRPETDLTLVSNAWSQVRRALDTFTDEQARGPSLLPGWTRGHLLTHLARSGDGDRRCAESAAVGEVGVKYPGGAEARAAGIEDGATRPARELIADLTTAQGALVATWATLPDEAWLVLADTPAGMRPIAELVVGRRRELLVHLVDLDVGVTSPDLPADYFVTDEKWIAEFRPDW